MKKGSPYELRKVNACIYCGCTEDLRDEHILPVGIGGQTYIGSGSCPDCEKVTCALEGYVLQHQLGALRTAMRFPTRRPKKRANTLPITVIQPDGSRRTIQVGANQYPAFTLMPRFKDRAGILRGAPEREVQEIDYIKADVMEYTDRFAAVGHTTLERQISINPAYFVRFLTKVAYCYVVGSLGRDAVDPMMLHLIRGADNTIPFYVGDRPDYAAENDTRSTTRMCIESYTMPDGSILLVVPISLFSGKGIPAYEVVVGRLLRKWGELEPRDFHDQARIG